MKNSGFFASENCRRAQDLPAFGVQLAANARARLFVRGECARVDRVGQNFKRAIAEQPFSGLVSARKRMRIRAVERGAQQQMQHSEPAVRIVAVRDAHLRAAAARGDQIERERA